MANLTVPFNAQVTYKVTFLNSAGAALDPDTIELDVGEETFTFADAQITRTGVGLYEKTIVHSEPGRFKRIWVGQGPGNYYVESKPTTIQVLGSNR